MWTCIPVEYELFLKSSVWQIYDTLTCTITPGLTGRGNYDNEGVLYNHLRLSRFGTVEYAVCISAEG